MAVTLWSATRQHPVGQGFFLSGWVTDGKVSLTYVYDCGSSNDPGRVARRREADRLVFDPSLVRGGKFDVLFISHLHEDHVNGIPALLAKVQPKVIVMPMVPLIERLLLLCGNSPDDFLDLLAINPRAALRELTPEASIVELDPEVNEPPPIGLVEESLLIGEEEVGVLLPAPGRPRPRRAVSTLSAGSKRLWVLHSWALKGLDELSDQLAVALGLPDAGALDAECLTALLATRSERARLKAACLRVLKAAGHPADFNRTSLCLFSGPAVKPTRTMRTRSVSYRQRKHRVSDREEALVWAPRGGWLGTGDAPLNDRAFRLEFAREFRSFYDVVGTLAIPHHGAAGDWAPEAIACFRTPPLCVASFGSAGRFGHPDSATIRSISDAGAVFVGVTENPKSGFTQASRVDFG